MENLVKAFGTIFLAIAGILFFTILGALMGALSGLIVGLVFSETILGIFTQLGIHDVAMWQIGAFLGWVGGFLKTKVSK